MIDTNNNLHIVDFKTDQIIGVIQEKEYWDDLRHWEMKNNVDQFDFTVSDGTKHAAKLMQQNLIVKQTRDGTFVSYVIIEGEQVAIGRSKKIYTVGEHTKLKKAAVIKPQTLQGSTVNESVDFALQDTEWKRGITEYGGIRTIHIKEFTNPLDVLKQIASTFDLEIRYRTEIVGNVIVGRYVDVVEKVGRDNGKEFELGKDVQGIRRIENSQNIITALVGIGPLRENPEIGEEEYLTFEEINNGKLYVSDNDAFQRWSKDGEHVFEIYSPETEDQNMTKERLKQLTEAELQKRINSSVSYEVDAVALEKVFGLSHEAVHKGDIVRIKDKGFFPPLFLEARLIAAGECDTDSSKDKYIFGDYREISNTNDEMNRMFNKIMGVTVRKDSILSELNNNKEEDGYLNADKVRIKNGKVLIDENGVTVSIADFLNKDERGLKTTVISKRNLIADHDFSSVPKKVMTGNSDYSHFEVGRFWRPKGNVVLENNTLNFDYERMVNATRVDQNNYVETTAKNGIYPGKTYTTSAHFRCAKINGVRATARPKLQVCFVTYRDNTYYEVWHEEKISFDAPSTVYGDIERRAYTFKVPQNYNVQEHAVVIRFLSEDGDISKGTGVCVSGVQLVTGKYPSMYDWQAQSAEVYAGTMPIDSLSFGYDQGLIGIAQDRQTFDFAGTTDVKFFNNIRAMQGVNLGGNEFQGWGHIRFADGNRGIGFYVRNANGWFFNSLG